MLLIDFVVAFTRRATTIVVRPSSHGWYIPYTTNVSLFSGSLVRLVNVSGLRWLCVGTVESQRYCLRGRATAIVVSGRLVWN